MCVSRTELTRDRTPDSIRNGGDKLPASTDAGRNGLVLIDPPAAEERKEAAGRMSEVCDDRNSSSGAD